MKDITQLTTAISQNAHKPTFTQTNSMQTLHSDSQTNSQRQTAITKQEIASLFNGWKRLFRSKMKDEDWDTDTVIVWSIALADLQMTASEFAAAKRKSLGLQWAPTAPADFLALGRTDTASNYPDSRQTYLQAAQGEYKHEVALETAKRVGIWELKTQPESVSYKSWQRHYPEVCSEHQNGESLVIPKSHQVAYEHTPVQQGTAASANIDAFLAKFGSKKGETV